VARWAWKRSKLPLPIPFRGWPVDAVIFSRHPRPHPLGPLSLCFILPFLCGVSNDRAQLECEQRRLLFPVPVLLLHYGGSDRRPYVAMVQASREGRGRGGRSTHSGEGPLDRGASSSGSHEAARVMEVSQIFGARIYLHGDWFDPPREGCTSTYRRGAHCYPSQAKTLAAMEKRERLRSRGWGTGGRTARKTTSAVSSRELERGIFDIWVRLSCN
jgi:hypothetical protein